ncbi:MAG: hypothetical protein HY735_03640 [Verrucomicrobia bacterium]|nr:hypothetical protein [Verrucomicrobiota bacterium]
MKTLRELAENVRDGRPLEIELGDFLDAFYLAPDPARVQERPALLASAHPQGTMIDAFLAAAAEHLCRRFEFSIPDWVYERGRCLDRPFFALPSPAFRTTLLLESPMEFRSRNLFVTANALNRASEHASERRPAGREKAQA